MPPIPPYEYPASPTERSSPGDSHEQPKEPVRDAPRIAVPNPEVPVRPIPYTGPADRPPGVRDTPVKETKPTQEPTQVVMSHPETVTLPPTQEVQRYQKPIPEQPKNEPKRIPETIPEKVQKEFPEQFGNNSETIRKGNSLEPDKQAPVASGGGYKKKGKVGRQRKYEEVGNNGEIPVKKVVLFRHLKGRHWPGMSQDMQEWYNKYYFTKPKKTGKAADHDRHVKSYERGQRWIAEHEGRAYQPTARTVGHSGNVIAYRKRATS